jgi:hypothetical protein
LTRYFCTYFDHRYLARGLALLESLRRHCPDFRLWVLCMDEPCHHALQKLDASELILIPLAQLEASDPAILAARSSRSLIEYYFTLTPALPRYVLDEAPEVELISYIDSDLFFFSGPEPLFEELGTDSILMIAHRYGYARRELEAFGKYNVGFLSFRRDQEGVRCLDWWRARCLEWCYDRLEDNKFADQKYLDRWPELFRRICNLSHKGANLAPWNVANYSITLRDGHVRVDEDPLIFFHFHGLKLRAPGIFDPQLERYQVRPTPAIRGLLYRPYLDALQRATETATALLAGVPTEPDRSLRAPPPATHFLGLRTLKAKVLEIAALVHGVYNRQFIYSYRGRVL